MPHIWQIDILEKQPRVHWLKGIRPRFLPASLGRRCDRNYRLVPLAKGSKRYQSHENVRHRLLERHTWRERAWNKPLVARSRIRIFCGLRDKPRNRPEWPLKPVLARLTGAWRLPESSRGRGPGTGRVTRWNPFEFSRVHRHFDMGHYEPWQSAWDLCLRAREGPRTRASCRLHSCDCVWDKKISTDLYLPKGSGLLQHLGQLH